MPPSAASSLAPGAGLRCRARCVGAASHPNPAGHTATFVLESSGSGYFSRWQAASPALKELGTLLPAAGREFVARVRAEQADPEDRGDRLELVGEQGPELVSLPDAAEVTEDAPPSGEEEITDDFSDDEKWTLAMLGFVPAPAAGRTEGEKA